jgi:hypothetical protein
MLSGYIKIGGHIQTCAQYKKNYLVFWLYHLITIQMNMGTQDTWRKLLLFKASAVNKYDSEN